MGLANDESEIYTGIEDGRRTKFFHTRFRILELSCASFSFLGMLLSVIQVKMRENIINLKGLEVLLSFEIDFVAKQIFLF